MADVKFSDILDAIVERLAVPDGVSTWTSVNGTFGTWHVNTSVAGAIIISMTPSSALPQGAPLPMWQIVPLMRFTQEPLTQGAYLLTGTVAIIGYAPSSDGWIETRLAEALNMLSDGKIALELDLSLGGLLWEPLFITRGEANGLELNEANSQKKLGQCFIEVELKWRRFIGTGI